MALYTNKPPEGPVQNLHHQLLIIRYAPGLILGSVSLTALHSLLNGYKLALDINDIPAPGDRAFFDGFYPFIERYYAQTNTMGWYGILMNESEGKEERALELFFERYEDFHAGRSLPDNPKNALSRLLDLLLLEPEKVREILGEEANVLLPKLAKDIRFYLLSERYSDYESVIQVTAQDETTLPAFQRLLAHCGYRL
ncbi:MAG: hypothetical protein EOP50_05750 [Sphingobacteriales bacterium]|nr:MAG: hypothetical protein EOP50_05750 [Sphingobacteriales bacterium]